MRNPGQPRPAGYQRFQALQRMRVPGVPPEHTLRIYVVRAIRRDPAIDDGLYCQALQDLCQGDNSDVFNDLLKFTAGVVSGELNGRIVDAAAQVWSSSRRVEHDDGAYPNIAEFNHRFLNGKGLQALLTLLLFDAAGIDPVAVDKWKGGNALDAAYGLRKTRRQRKLGRGLQTFLKQFPVVDEPAVTEAAEQYVEYRFLDHGSLPDYMRRKELEGGPRSDRYLRDWFKKFDKALGFPPPPLGRPRKKRR